MVNDVIHQDHREAILCAGIRTAAEPQFNELLKKLAQEENFVDRNRFVAALGCTSNIQWAERLLQMTINNQSRHFRTAEERYLAFSGIAGNNYNGTKLAFVFLEANLDSVYALYDSGNVNSAVRLLATFVASKELKEKVNTTNHHYSLF